MISRKTKKRLENAAFLNVNPYEKIDNFLMECNKFTSFFTAEERYQLDEFKRNGNRDGYILLESFKVNKDLIPTPIEHSEVMENKAFFSENYLGIFGSIFGEIYNFKAESEGYIFNNIRPKQSYASLQSSQSSDVFLELHTELAFHDHRPDFVLLFCQRSDRNNEALTGVSSIRNIIHKLPKNLQNELRKPSFEISSDLSFYEKGQNMIKTITPLEGDICDPYLVYDSDLMVPKTNDAQQALTALDTLLRENMKEVSLSEGDLIIIDNRRTVHSRTNFTAYYDGKDRWLQRAFVTQDYDKIRKKFANNDRVLENIM